MSMTKDQINVGLFDRVKQLQTELAAMTKERDAEREKVAKPREIATHFLGCPICAYDAAECERGARYMKALEQTK